MADGVVKVTVVGRDLQSLKKNIAAVNKEFKGVRKEARLLDTGVNSLGNRLGFVAFQMTFLAGVAGRALGEITQRLNTMVNDGSKDLSTIGRAIVRSGFDISASSGEAREAVDLLNNAMRTFGAGRTIFNNQEVAGAFDAVGRAVNFAGTEVERAKQQIIVANEVLKLMTIEEQSADSAAINFVKSMKLFSIGVEEASRVSDVLVAVNNQSTITLDGLVRSLGFAGQQARAFGLTFEETAATLGVVQDRLGVLNGGPGRNLSILLQNLASTSTSLNADLLRLGVSLRDNEGQMKGVVDIVGQFNTALKNAGKEGSLARQQILEMINATSRGERTLLALVQGYDELQESISAAEEAEGLAKRMSSAFEQLPAERINRMKNAVNSLRVELVGALSPAIEEVTNVIRELAVDSNIQLFMKEVGTTLAQTVVPAVKTLANIFKGFIGILKSNEFLLKLVVGGFTSLLGILTSLFIIGTIGALLAAMASVIQRTATAQATLALATNATFASFLKFAVALFGIFLILKGIDKFLGVFKDGIEASEAPALAAAAALTALGVALTVLPFRMTGVRDAIQKSGSLFGGFTPIIRSTGASLKEFGRGAVNLFKQLPFMVSEGIRSFPTLVKDVGGKLGGALKGGVVGSAKGLVGGIRGLIGTLGKAGMIGAAIAAAAAIGFAIKNELDTRVADSRLFVENDGFQTEHEAFWFQFKAAFASGVREVIKFLSLIPEAMQTALNAAGELVFKFGQDARVVFDKLFEGDIPAAIEAAQRAINNLVSGSTLDDLFHEILTTVDAETLAKETIVDAINSGLASGKDIDQIGLDIADIIKVTNTADIFDDEKLREIFEDMTGLHATKIQELIHAATNPTLHMEGGAIDMVEQQNAAEELANQQMITADRLSELAPQLEALKQNITDAVSGGGISQLSETEIQNQIDMLAQ
jgi:TP901 family phage tail tape measure protein